MNPIHTAGGRNLVLWLLLAVVYFTATKLGLSLAAFQNNASPVWPPTGIAMAAVLIWGYRVFPGIFIGCLLAYLTNAIPTLAALGIATGNTLEALAGGYLIVRYVQGRPWLDSIYGVAGFLLSACLVATLISAGLGPLSLWLAGVIETDILANVVWTWWLGDAMGALLVTPFLIVWHRPQVALQSGNSGWEKLAITLAFVVVGILAFGVFAPTAFNGMPIVFLALPVMLWALLRWGQAGVTLSALLLTLCAVIGTVRGYGPFVSDNANESLIMLQSFLGMVTASGLLGAAAVREQVSAKHLEREAREALEERVAERTYDLSRSQEKQTVINRLLQIGLDELPMEQKLQQALEVVAATSWLKNSPKAGLFLIDAEQGELRLYAHLNFPVDQLHTCERKKWDSVAAERPRCNSELCIIPISIPITRYVGVR